MQPDNSPDQPARSALRVLVIDDDRRVADWIASELAASPRGRFAVEVCSTLTEGLELLHRGKHDVTILDLGLPEGSGQTILFGARAAFENTAAIVLTDGYQSDLTMEAIRLGAHDALAKPLTAASELDRQILVASEKHRKLQELRQARAAARQRARRDPLTGLLNRTAFLEDLQRLVGGASRAGDLVALLYLDIDRFKELNDSQGHAAGDKVLEALGARITEVGGSSSIVARLGGDEFVLAARIATIDEAHALAERLYDRIKGAGSATGWCSASIGIALYPIDAEALDELLEKADLAMYEAKRSGTVGYILCSEAGKSPHSTDARRSSIYRPRGRFERVRLFVDAVWLSAQIFLPGCRRVLEHMNRAGPFLKVKPEAKGLSPFIAIAPSSIGLALVEAPAARVREAPPPQSRRQRVRCLLSVGAVTGSVNLRSGLRLSDFLTHQTGFFALEDSILEEMPSLASPTPAAYVRPLLLVNAAGVRLVEELPADR